MSNSITKTSQDIHPIDIAEVFKLTTCLKCGGNGYMKSNPNCYHTCLECLGRGLKEKK